MHALYIILSINNCRHQRVFLLEKHDMFCRELKTLAQLGGVHATDRHLTVFRQLDPANALRPDISLPGLGQGGSRLLRHNEALKKIIDYKMRNYERICHELGFSFMAAAVEITGTMADDL